MTRALYSIAKREQGIHTKTICLGQELFQLSYREASTKMAEMLNAMLEQPARIGKPPDLRAVEFCKIEGSNVCWLR